MSAASVLRQKCLKAAQKLARMSAADDDGYCSCVSCSKSLHYKQMDGGHFIPKGASSFWICKMLKADYVDLLKELESLINVERERLGE